MSHPDAKKWNAIYTKGQHNQDKPARVLKEYSHLLPESGLALDLACGRGANAIFLAGLGLDVSAWDISEQAIKSLLEKSEKLKLKIDTRICNIPENPPQENSYNVIVVSYYLERKLFPAIIKALKPGGLLFYQTFIRDYVDKTGPSNDEFRLKRNELLVLCNQLQVILYHEEGHTGNINSGFRNEVMFIGQKHQDP